MSTILKALRRLEDDKQKQVETDQLHGEVLASEPTRKRRLLRRVLISAGVVVGIAFAVLMIAAVVTILTAPDSEVEEAVEVAEVEVSEPIALETAAPPEAAVAAPLVVTPPPVENAAAVPAEASAEAQLEQKRRKEALDRLVEKRDAKRRKRIANRFAAEEAAAAAAQSAPPALPLEAVAPRVAPEPKQLELARVEPPKARQVEPEPVTPRAFETPETSDAAPFGLQAPARRQPLLPDDLDVVRTRWHPRAERRIAYLSLPGDRGTVEFVEGEFYGEWVIKEIQLGGVVFQYDGATIVRSVGRSN
jgi:hypothetical protein